MQVQELIEALFRMPPDAEVYFPPDSDEYMYTLAGIELDDRGDVVLLD